MTRPHRHQQHRRQNGDPDSACASGGWARVNEHRRTLAAPRSTFAILCSWALFTLIGAPEASWSQPVAAAEEDWFLVETENFDVLGNVSPSELQEHAIVLEALHGALGRLNAGRVRLPPIPPRVILLRSDDWFRQYAPARMSAEGSRSSGYYHSGEYLDHLVVRAGPRARPRRTLLHEGIHAFMHHNVPSAPLWLNEGLAELYSTLQIEETERGVRAVLGAPQQHHLRTLSTGGSLAWRTLLEADTQTRLYHQGNRRPLFYAQSWALVHYLLLGREEGGTELRAMLEALERGDEPLRAFTDSFGRYIQNLDDALTRHLAGPLPRVRFPLDLATIAVSEPARLPPTTAIRMLGELWLSSGGREAARRHFDVALDLEPRNARALAGLGQLAERRQDLQTARSWYEQAVEADGDDPWGHFLLGQVVVRSSVDRELRPEELRAVDGARSHLRRCTSAWPAFGPAWASLGLSWLVDSTEPEKEALRALRRASELLPRRADITYHWAMAHILRSEWQQARGIIRGELRQRRNPELESRASRALAHGRVEQAARWVDEGRPTAEALLDDLESDPDPDLSELAPRVAEIRRVLEFNGAVELYNGAVEALRAGDAESARDLAERAVARSNDRELRKAARNLLRSLER